MYTYVRVAVRSFSPGSTPSVHPHSSGHVRAKNGTVARVHARACRATRFQPLRNKSSEENLPEGINVGVGSPHVLCPPPLVSRRGLSCTPAALIARPRNAVYSQGIFSSGFARLTSDPARRAAKVDCVDGRAVRGTQDRDESRKEDGEEGAEG